MDKERFLRSLLPTSSNGEASVEEEGTINYFKLEETTAIINNDYIKKHCNMNSYLLEYRSSN